MRASWDVVSGWVAALVVGAACMPAAWGGQIAAGPLTTEPQVRQVYEEMELQLQAAARAQMMVSQLAFEIGRGNLMRTEQ
jgi:hypothetical protein